MDIARLRELTRENTLAKTVFHALATRDRPRAITDLDRLRRAIAAEDGLAIDPREFLAIFKKMQDAGFGTIINPRKPTDNHRFKWKYNLIEVGERAMANGVVGRAKEPGVETITVTYPLRGDMLQLPIPRDLTKKEAEELGEFIRRFGR